MTIDTMSVFHQDLFKQLWACRSELFTGHLLISSPGATCTWDFLFFHGRIVADAGGINPESRWFRQVHRICPKIAQNLLQDLSWQDSWCYYQRLQSYYRRSTLPREQVTAMITGNLLETLFDLYQWNSQEQPFTVSRTSTTSIDAETGITFLQLDAILKQAHQCWTQWQEAGLTFSPHGIPIIIDAEQLQQTAPSHSYQTLSTLVTGEKSIYDLAVTLKQSPYRIAKSLKGYIEKDLISVKPNLKLTPKTQDQPNQAQESKPRIVYIDDDMMSGQRMQHVLAQVACHYRHIQDPTVALTDLIQQPPDLIFLDLVMPQISGYELCSQLRRISKLKDIPVLIVTGNDGVIDRMRSKVVGATGFVAKPIIPEVIYQHLQSLGLAAVAQKSIPTQPILTTEGRTFYQAI